MHRSAPVFFALRFALFPATFFGAFFAGRRDDFFSAGRRWSSSGGAEVKEVLEGVAGVEAGVGGAGGSEGSGSIHPEPDQPISI